MGRKNAYDAAMVDLMLPKLDGLGVIERWRAEGIKIPVLILSAKRSLDDRITGLQRGGDDYLTKPFSFAELLARLQALIRRSGSSAVVTSLTFADLKMDLLTREVWRGTTKIELQAREFLLLEYLLRNQNKVVSKTMILEHVWNYHFDPADQRRRRPRLPPAQQNRPRLRAQAHPHPPRRRLQPAVALRRKRLKVKGKRVKVTGRIPYVLALLFLLTMLAPRKPLGRPFRSAIAPPSALSSRSVSACG